jgi:anti-anti-sigma factor
MTSPDLLSIERKMDCLWIMLPDAITMYNTRDLESMINGKLEKKVNVVLDFTNTMNLFSSGLGLIIRIRKKVNEYNGSVALVNVSEKMRGLLESLNLDKVFSIYATDVEFEISRSDIWKKHLSKNELGLLFAHQIESNLYRIHISGEMIRGVNFDQCNQFNPSPDIVNYIFDLSNLELIDQDGSNVLLDMTRKINQVNGHCYVFGVEKWIQKAIEAFGAAEYLTFYEDEKSVLEKCNL